MEALPFCLFFHSLQSAIVGLSSHLYNNSTARTYITRDQELGSMRHFLVGLALLAGLLATLTAVPGRAQEKTEAQDIEKLVQQLASGRFNEREKAQKKLEA